MVLSHNVFLNIAHNIGLTLSPDHMMDRELPKWDKHIALTDIMNCPPLFHSKPLYENPPPPLEIIMNKNNNFN